MYIYFLYLLVGIIVSISTLIMMKWFHSNRMLNFYIIKISIILCVFLILNGSKRLNWLFDIADFGNLNYSQVILLLSPSFYLYFKKLADNNKFPDYKDLSYFLIPISLHIYVGSESYIGNTFHYSLIFFLFVSYTLFYYYKSYILINNMLFKFTNDIKSNPVYKSWISFIFLMAGLVFLHFYLSQILPILKFDILNSCIPDLIFLAIFLVSYLKVMTTPELFFGTAYLRNISKVQTINNLKINTIWNLNIDKNKLGSKEILIYNKVHSDISDYISQIENSALVNVCFRKPGYSISNLSTDIGLPKYFLEFIFKYYCTITYTEYKKVVRVYDAIQLINNDFLKYNKLETLAKTVGFASYNPFLINFKEITGVSPNIYFKERRISNFIFISDLNYKSKTIDSNIDLNNSVFAKSLNFNFHKGI